MSQSDSNLQTARSVDLKFAGRCGGGGNLKNRVSGAGQDSVVVGQPINQATHPPMSAPIIPGINPISSKNDDAFDVFSMTGELIHKAVSIDSSDKEQVNTICEASYAAFKKWSHLSINKKVKIYSQIIANLEKYSVELAESHTEIGAAQWFADFSNSQIKIQVEHYQALLRTKQPGTLPVQPSKEDGETTADLAIVLKQPIGPVLAISPWNAPGILAMRAILAPLTAGCSVILKSSELAPRVAYLIARCFSETDLPESTVTLVHVKPNESAIVVPNFIANRRIKKINFTGSTRTGYEIGRVAGQFAKPVTLELGGKNCSIIKADVDDLPKALGGSLWSAWCHLGQILIRIMLFLKEVLHKLPKQPI
ncbi:unnamed protein product [Ambrosiozyma monospora]|uniref:Unnamed protein product n=1 Tax=Ambrosiozyma monospora TaxID=43982 RepID=A0ACB5T9A5_AMBMO|nr:unnamed protein product [Ambrosiozyma monospora]